MRHGRRGLRNELRMELAIPPAFGELFCDKGSSEEFIVKTILRPDARDKPIALKH
jgi:hypothetical protein